MPALPNPWVILAVVVALAATWVYRGETVRAERDTYWKGQVAAANEAAAKAAREADATVHAASTKAQADVDAIAARLDKALGDLDAANRSNTSLRAAVDAGERVLIRVRADAARAASTVRDASAAAADRGEVYAELPAETVRALDDIARDANAAAIKHNACVDAYNDVRNRLKELSDGRDRIPDVLGAGAAATADAAPGR